MTEELTKAAQQALEQLEFLNACYPHKTAADAIAALRSALTQRPAAQTEREADDGDITGQSGPLPETGWDEVPEGAFRKPSPTAGMNLGERIKHVGGRENAAGYIEFGSVAAVRALVRQYLRDLPTPQQATPDQFADASKMVPPVALRSVHLTRDTAGMCVVRINGRVAIRDNGDIIDHMATLEWFADTQQATPEPVGEPAAWRWFNSNGDQVTNWLDFKPSQKANVEAQVAEAGGRIEYAYTRPAPGVPDWAECLRISETADVDEALRLFAEGETSEDQAVCIVRAVLAAAQAKQ